MAKDELNDRLRELCDLAAEHAAWWVENWAREDAREPGPLRKRLTALVDKVSDLALDEGARRVQRHIDARVAQEQGFPKGGISEQLSELADQVPRWARISLPPHKGREPLLRGAPRAMARPSAGWTRTMAAEVPGVLPSTEVPPTVDKMNVFPLLALVQRIQGRRDGESETYPGATCVRLIAVSEDEPRSCAVLLETDDSLQKVLAHYRARAGADPMGMNAEREAELRYENATHTVVVRIVALPYGRISIKHAETLKFEA